MWFSGKTYSNWCPLWVIYLVGISLQTSIGSASPEPLPEAVVTPPTIDDGVQRIGVGEVLIVDEFGREARSYWDAAAAEEKVETVTVYGGMEVVSGGSSNSGGPDVVKGHAVKERQGGSSEDESLESELPGQNSIRDSALEITLLDCVLQGDLPCIQKKAFRALQKLIQMSQSSSLPETAPNQDKLSSKENNGSMEKVDKSTGLFQNPGWWVMGSGTTGATPKPGSDGANPVDEVIKALSSSGGMSRLLEEVRDLVVDLVSNVISLQEVEEDRMRKMEKRSGDEIIKQRQRRSVVPKKGAGPVPLGFGSRPLPSKRLGEKMGVEEQEGAPGKVEGSTSIQRGGAGGGGGHKKRKNGMNTILMGIMTLKSIFSYIGLIFSHIFQLKQLGLSVLIFLVSVARLVLLLRQQNHDKPPVTDTKVVYLRPQHTPSHYGDHIQPQHYGGEHYIKRSFDAISDAIPSDESAHEMAYGAQKP